MNIYLIIMRFVYAVSLHRGLKSGGYILYCPQPKMWESYVPMFPVSCTHGHGYCKFVIKIISLYLYTSNR